MSLLQGALLATAGLGSMQGLYWLAYWLRLKWDHRHAKGGQS